jgi:ABC-type nitrate/sulfonate/bicarbonate transport system ATPase subunit
MTENLQLREVGKTFYDGAEPLPVLDSLDLAAGRGEFVVLIGPSGSGKSTIFNLITGLLRPDSGDILLDGVSIVGRAGMVGDMPQRELLLPWRTVLENVILGPELAGHPRQEARARAKALLPRFGLDGFGDAYPSALSGGMRQRAALLRTFLCERDVILLDEPFGALDALTRRDLQFWLLDVWAEFRPTILFITHDIQEAVLLADRVLVFSARPARVTMEVAVTLPRPRQPVDPAFVALEAHLLEALSLNGQIRNGREPTP